MVSIEMFVLMNCTYLVFPIKCALGAEKKAGRCIQFRDYVTKCQVEKMFIYTFKSLQKPHEWKHIVFWEWIECMFKRKYLVCAWCGTKLFHLYSARMVVMTPPRKHMVLLSDTSPQFLFTPKCKFTSTQMGNEVTSNSAHLSLLLFNTLVVAPVLTCPTDYCY